MACSAFLAFAERSDLQGNDLLRIRNSSYARASSLARFRCLFARRQLFRRDLGSRPRLGRVEVELDLDAFGSCMKSW